MDFEDNFVQPVAEWLIDPVLKVRMVTSAPRESYGFTEADLLITYDPEIQPGRLTQPPSPETRARRLAIPALAHLADEPNIFESKESKRITSVPLEWSAPTDVLRLKVALDGEYIKSWVRGIIDCQLPQISDCPANFLLYCVKAVVKLDSLRRKEIHIECPQVRRLEVAIRTEVARDVFRLPLAELDEVELGWVCVGSREIRQ